MGFGHPAVITVACVLVLSRGPQTSGAVDALTRRVLPAQAGMMLSLTALVGLGAVLSGFMNNVAAMALLMPVAVQTVKRLENPPGAHAPGLRHDLGRHDDDDRHATQSYRFWLSCWV